MVTIAELLALGTKQLCSNSAKLDAEVLLALAITKQRSYLYTWPDQQLTTQQEQHYKALLHRRILGEPIAHITGEREFWSLNLIVNRHTLIPRPETETLVSVALEQIKKTGAKRILDLGTGSGAIALALASEQPQLIIDATDKSLAALEIGQNNARKHKLHNITFIQSDWFSALKDKYDLIVSNPPYIDKHDPHLQQGDLRFEPQSALVADEHGLADIYHLINHAKKFLSQGGQLCLEHGYQQAKSIREQLQRQQFKGIKTILDLSAAERVTCGYHESNIHTA